MNAVNVHLEYISVHEGHSSYPNRILNWEAVSRKMLAAVNHIAHHFFVLPEKVKSSREY